MGPLFAASAAPVRIACLSSPTSSSTIAAAFRRAFAKFDPSLSLRAQWTEHYAAFDPARLRQLAAMLNRERPDLILCFDFDAAVAVVATRASPTVPLVFRAHDDPLDRGLIDSYARPGRNLTGITTYRCLDDKLVEIVRDALPYARRVGFIHDGAIADAGCNARARQYAKAEGIELLDLSVSNGTQLTALLDRLDARSTQALIVAATAVTWPMRAQLIARINALAIPAVYEGQVFVDAGGLLQFSALQDDAMERMAQAASHVLRHGSAGEFPVSQPTRFELVINLRARNARSFHLSPQILRRADRILE